MRWFKCVCNITMQAVNRFCATADDLEDVPTLQGDKSYTMYKLNAREWKIAAAIRDALKVMPSVSTLYYTDIF